MDDSSGKIEPVVFSADSLQWIGIAALKTENP